MRILYIISFFYPAFKFGGPAFYPFNLIKSLQKKGITVDVVTSNAGLEGLFDIKTGEWINISGIRVKYLKNYGSEKFIFIPQIFFTLFGEIEKYDIVHMELFWSFSTMCGCMASLIKNKPFVITPAGTLYQEAIEMKSTFAKKLYYSLMAKHFVRKVRAMIYTTEDEKNNIADFIKIDILRSYIIPTGFDLDSYKKLPLKGEFKKKHPILIDKKYILFLGRIHPKKGIDLLIEAFKIVAENDKNIALVIVGPDNDGYAKNIQAKIKKYCLNDKVLFTGLLTGDEKLSTYVDAEMFVLPSYSENFAAAAVEAMACGTPVVISDKVGISDLVKEYNAGVIIKAGDISSLAIGIKSLLESPLLAKEYVSNAKKLITEKFDIQKVSDSMISAYKEIIDGHDKRK